MAVAALDPSRGNPAGVFAPERRDPEIFPIPRGKLLLEEPAFLSAMHSRVAGIDHLQIAAPEGCESAARDFYGSILGMKEMEKPAVLRARGGCWFECGSQQLHIGMEKDFRPARKAHPAFAVFHLDELCETLTAHGIKVVEDDNLPGAPRFYAEDPWGNRLEFVDLPG
jgi:catechol 2,3-dioxygenase-like lactoylglutathione lyase family enzyme